MKVVQALPSGPVDLIADVHGELDALLRVLARLGVNPESGSVQRPLVFLGDLIDRGPDSVAVCEVVRGLCSAGVAHCIVGNHELNVLRRDAKEGNGWLLGHTDGYHLDGEFRAFDSQPATAAERTDLLAWMATLPIAMQRDDLRIVHACWLDSLLSALPDFGDLAELCRASDRSIRAGLYEQGIAAAADAERAEFANLLDPSLRPDCILPNYTRCIVSEQRENPIRGLTSGVEEPIEADEFAFLGGKWRTTGRSQWWNDYAGSAAVVVGHYWRRRGVPDPGKFDYWRPFGPFGWAGTKRNVFCLDYSVGRRYLERARGTRDGGFEGGLAAMRWPERTVVFDDRSEHVQT